MPGGEPAEHEVGAQHPADHAAEPRHAPGLVEVLHLVALRQDLAVDRHEARLAAVDVEHSLHAATGSLASTKARCHSDSSSRQ